MKCCELSAGMLRTPVAIQAIVKTPDGAGGFAHTWVTLDTVRAHVKPLSGSEAVRGMQIEDKVSHRIFMRYRADVKAKDRLLIEGEPYNIRAVLDLEMRKRWMEILAEKGVAT